MTTELILIFGLGTLFIAIIVLVERYGTKGDNGSKKRGEGGFMAFIGGDGVGSDGGGGGDGGG